MANFPQAKRSGLVAVDVAGTLVVQHADGREVARLDRLAGLVWRLADGKTGVGMIAQKLFEEFGVIADNEAVWAALDRLADADLISARITPPAASVATSRRGVLPMTAASDPSKQAKALMAAAIPGGMEEQIQKGAEEAEKRGKQAEAQVKEAGEKEGNAKEKLGKEAEELMKGKK